VAGGFLYYVSGWTVRSPRPLPYLLEAADAGADADIDLIFERFEAVAGEARKLGPFQVYGPDLVDIRLPTGLCIRIADGRRLMVDAPDHVGDSQIHTYLFGPAFAVLAQQRGQPALHSSAIEIGDGAIAVAGHSGAGKSTTVRRLMEHGHRFLTDDQLIVEPGTGIAHRSYPSTKMWADTAALLGKPIDEAAQVRPGIDKYHFAAADQFAERSMPLRAIFILAPDANIAEPDARRLPLPEAIGTLSRFVHYAEIARAMGAEPVMLRWAARIAGRVPVYLVRRPENPAKVEALIDLLLGLAAEKAPEA
jgi:hypothetical protein